MKNPWSWLIGFGKGITFALGFIKAQFNEEEIHHAAGLVKLAEAKFIDNSERREWVVGLLMKRLPESLARLLVELALQFVKKQAADLTDKLADDL